MSEVEVPAGVGFASLAVVGRVARVILRSDCRYTCLLCKLSPIAVGGETVDDAYWADIVRWGVACQHIDDVRRMGVVRLLTDSAGRQYPEFVWKRGGHTTVASWPTSDDPDGAVEVLADAIHTTLRGSGWATNAVMARTVAERAIAGMQRKGYVVVPEWLSRVKPKDAVTLTGRGARVIDFSDEDPT